MKTCKSFCIASFVLKLGISSLFTSLVALDDFSLLNFDTFETETGVLLACFMMLEIGVLVGVLLIVFSLWPVGSTAEGVGRSITGLGRAF